MDNNENKTFRCLFNKYFYEAKEVLKTNKITPRTEWAIIRSLQDGTKSNKHYMLIQEVMDAILKEKNRDSYSPPRGSKIKTESVKNFVVPFFADKGVNGNNCRFQIDRDHTGLGRSNILGKSKIFFLDREKAKQTILANNKELSIITLKGKNYFLIKLEENLL